MIEFTFATIEKLVFIFVISAVITFGIWRDIDHFRLRKRIKKLEAWKKNIKQNSEN